MEYPDVIMTDSGKWALQKEYRYKDLVVPVGFPTDTFAHRVFKEILQDYDVPDWKVWLMYKSVKYLRHIGKLLS